MTDETPAFMQTPYSERPKPRVKASFFDVVPDAFSGRSLDLTGDSPRRKRPSVDSTVPKKGEEKVENAIEETIEAAAIVAVEAQPWDTKESGVMVYSVVEDFSGDLTLSRFQQIFHVIGTDL